MPDFSLISAGRLMLAKRCEKNVFFAVLKVKSLKAKIPEMEVRVLVPLFIYSSEQKHK